MPGFWTGKPTLPESSLRALHLGQCAVLALLAAVAPLLAGPGRPGSMATLGAGLAVAAVWGLGERLWANEHDIDFLPREEAAARLKAAMRPWPYALARGLLFGLLLAQLLPGQPAWRLPPSGWAIGAAGALAMVAMTRRWRPAAAGQAAL